MRTRKLRLVSALLALAMLLAMVPVGAFAESDDTPNLVTVPEDKLVINSAGVFSGIESNWLLQFKSANPDKLLKVVIPSSVIKIADDVFRSGKSLGNNIRIGPIIGAVDFSQATSLTSIGAEAFAQQTNLGGTIDLSNTSVTIILNSAFNSTAIIGVILPSTLQTIGKADASSGSSFAYCSKLEYVRTAGGNPDADFELPNTLTSIGRDTFRSSFAQSVKLNLPATVTTVGSQAFHSSKIEEIIVNYDGDFANYNVQAFLSNKLVVFKNKAAYDVFYKKASTTKSALTYPIKLTFAGTSISQDKLYNQSIQYEKDASGFWTLNSDYALPDASSNPSIPVGFTAKWMLNGSDLTAASKVNATNDTGDTAEATYSLALQAPTVEFTKNGVVQPSNQIDVTLTKGKEQTVGIKLSHPLLDKQLDNDEAIAIFYYWFDYKDFQSGPRNTAESNIFGKYVNGLSEIPITQVEHTRNNPDAYRLYFQLGYQKGNNTYWYKQTSTPTIIYVTVTQPDEYTISYDLNGGTAADGASYDDEYVVVGNSFTAKAAPTKDGYIFTGWRDDDAKTYKAGETITPAGNMTLTAQWEEAPTPVVPDPEPAKTYPVSSDFGKLTDQKDGGNAVSSASKGQRIYISLPEDKQTQGDMKFTYWDVQPESLKDALIASGFDPYSTETSFEMPELADGQTLTINPHYEPMDSDSGDDSFLMTAAAVAGGAALTGFVAWQGYNIFAEVYMKQALPAGAAIPQNRQELALLLWNKAGNPAPADSTLYTDIDADDANAQAAARWAVENELLKPADKNDSNVFKPEKSVSVGQVYRAWNKTETLNAQ